MEYKGYIIKKEFDHYLITDQENKEIARTDTIEEAKQEIDNMEN